MSVSQYFSSEFIEARDKFVASAIGHKALCAQITNPLPGPEFDELTTDVAYLGKANARRLLVVFSGTHGVEFYAGGGCQTGWLNENSAESLPPETALLMIHAINPHGAAWRRRFNEDNVDLNRNFVDHGTPHFQNPFYAELHDHLTPSVLDGPLRKKSEDGLRLFRESKGEGAYNIGLLGQYSHPNGFYYGGSKPTWSNITTRKIINDYCHDRDHIAVIDLHSGLGPFGYGMVGILADPGSAAATRGYRWYGRAATTFAEAGQQIGFPDYRQFEQGFLLQAFNQELDDTALTLGGIEFGTYPIDVVTRAEIADVWLYNHAAATTPAVAESIRTEMLRVYYPNTPNWHTMVWWRFNQVMRQAMLGLNENE